MTDDLTGLRNRRGFFLLTEQEVVERLLENLEAFNARASLSYSLSLSAGSVPLDSTVTSIEDALQDADLAMYEQKRIRKALAAAQARAQLVKALGRD